MGTRSTIHSLSHSLSAQSFGGRFKWRPNSSVSFLLISTAGGQISKEGRSAASAEEADGALAAGALAASSVAAVHYVAAVVASPASTSSTLFSFFSPASPPPSPSGSKGSGERGLRITRNRRSPSRSQLEIGTKKQLFRGKCNSRRDP